MDRACFFYLIVVESFFFESDVTISVDFFSDDRNHFRRRRLFTSVGGVIFTGSNVFDESVLQVLKATRFLNNEKKDQFIERFKLVNLYKCLILSDLH